MPSTSHNQFEQPTPTLENRYSLEEVCGKSLATNTLVANGDEVQKGHHPWLTAIYQIKGINVEYMCGGSLITSKLVISGKFLVLIKSLN